MSCVTWILIRDSVYLAVSGDSIGMIIKSERREAYGAGKKNCPPEDKFSKRTPNLIKRKSVGTRGAWITYAY